MFLDLLPTGFDRPPIIAGRKKDPSPAADWWAALMHWAEPRCRNRLAKGPSRVRSRLPARLQA